MTTTDSNLIAELRHWADWCHAENIKAEVQRALHHAADDLARLTAELDGLEQDRASWKYTASNLQAERDRLAKDVEWWKSVCKSVDSERGKEIDRLRAALERVAQFNAVGVGSYSYAMELCRRIAREALASASATPSGVALAGGAATQSTAVPEPCVYSTSYCEKHKNMPWSMTIKSVAYPPRVVCPICEPPDARAGGAEK